MIGSAKIVIIVVFPPSVKSDSLLRAYRLRLASYRHSERSPTSIAITAEMHKSPPVWPTDVAVPGDLTINPTTAREPFPRHHRIVRSNRRRPNNRRTFNVTRISSKWTRNRVLVLGNAFATNTTFTPKRVCRLSVARSNDTSRLQIGLVDVPTTSIMSIRKWNPPDNTVER